MTPHRGPAQGSSGLPFSFDWAALGLLVALLVIAAMWWFAYGSDFLYRHFRWCTGCRRDAVNCSCPVTLTFTPWDELTEEEREDAE